MYSQDTRQHSACGRCSTHMNCVHLTATLDGRCGDHTAEGDKVEPQAAAKLGPVTCRPAPCSVAGLLAPMFPPVSGLPCSISSQASKGDPGWWEHLRPRLQQVLVPCLPQPAAPLRPGCLQTPHVTPQPTLLGPHFWQVVPMPRPITVSASPTGDAPHFFSSARACAFVCLF